RPAPAAICCTRRGLRSPIRTAARASGCARCQNGWMDLRKPAMRTSLIAFSLAAAAALVACNAEPPAGERVLSIRTVASPGAAESGQARLSVRPDGGAILSWLEPTDDGAALRYAVFDGG